MRSGSPRRERLAVDAKVAVGIGEKKADLARRCIRELLRVLLKRRPNRHPIAIEVKVTRRIGEPIEMQLEKRVSAVPEHGFDKEERFLAVVLNYG